MARPPLAATTPTSRVSSRTCKIDSNEVFGSLREETFDRCSTKKLPKTSLARRFRRRKRCKRSRIWADERSGEQRLAADRAGQSGSAEDSPSPVLACVGAAGGPG